MSLQARGCCNAQAYMKIKIQNFFWRPCGYLHKNLHLPNICTIYSAILILPIFQTLPGPQKTWKDWKVEKKKWEDQKETSKGTAKSNRKDHERFVLKERLQAASLSLCNLLSLLEDTKMAILQEMSTATHGCKHFIPQKARLPFPVCCKCMFLPTTSTYYV